MMVKSDPVDLVITRIYLAVTISKVNNFYTDGLLSLVVQ